VVSGAYKCFVVIPSQVVPSWRCGSRPGISNAELMFYFWAGTLLPSQSDGSGGGWRGGKAMGQVTSANSHVHTYVHIQSVYCITLFSIHFCGARVVRQSPVLKPLPQVPPLTGRGSSACRMDVFRAGRCTSIRGIGILTIFVFLLVLGVRLLGVLLRPARGALL